MQVGKQTAVWAQWSGRTHAGIHGRLAGRGSPWPPL